MLLLLGTICNIVLLGIAQDASNDVWGHALHGRIICEQGRLPHFSDYSCVPDDHTPRHFNCVNQIFFYSLLRIAGYPGLLFFKILSLAAACFFVGKALAINRVPWPWIGIACLLLMLVGHWRFVARGDTFNLVFWGFYLYWLEKFLEHPGKFIWWLLVWQIVWGNLHQLAFAGVGMIFLYALYCRTSGRHAQGHTLFRLGLLAMLASLLNFSSYHQITIAFVIWQGMSPKQRMIFDNIAEYQPLLDWGATVSFSCYCAVVLATFVLLLVTRRDRLWHHWPLFIALTGFSWRYRRFIGFFAVHTAFLLPLLACLWRRHQNETSGHEASNRPAMTSSVFTATIACLHLLFAASLASGIFFDWNHFPVRCRPEISNELFPVEAVKFLQRHHFAGNIYNSYDKGGYLGYHLYPTGKIFINSLGITAYEQEHYWFYTDIEKGKISPQSAVLAYDIEAFVLSHAGPVTPVIEWLAASEDWVLLYVDESYAIWGRSDSEFCQRVYQKEPLQPLALAALPRIAVSAHKLTALGSFFIDINQQTTAEYFLRHALTVDPDFADACTFLGMLAMQQGDAKKALAWWVKSAEKQANDAAQRNIAELFRHKLVFRANDALHQRARRLVPDIGK